MRARPLAAAAAGPAVLVLACFAATNMGADDVPCPAGTERRRESAPDGWASACVTPDGLKRGPYVYTHTNGVVLARGGFEENRPDGHWETWYSNGQKQDEGTYRAGQRTGWWTRWHDNGQKDEEGEYRNGYDQGFWRAWDYEGRLISAVPRNVECPEPLVWHDERPLLDAHPQTHALVTDGRQCRRRDRVRQGPSVSWFFGRRRLAHLGSYCDGDAQGLWSFFWPNGVLAREGAFTGPSLKHGTWTDWDDKGRKLRETDYLEGREVETREFSPAGPAAEPDPTLVDAAAVARYEKVLRQECSASPVTPRPYEGLRAELNAADAVLRIRVTARREPNRPPGWIWDSDPPPRQEVSATVKRVLAGSVARPGEQLRLFFDARQYAERSRVLPRYGSEIQFWNGPHEDRDQTALVKREGERLTLVTLMGADDAVLTDVLLERYAQLAAMDDPAFTRGLASLLADFVRNAPDRLLWAGWSGLAFDDWERLNVPLPPADPHLRRLASETHRGVLAQIDAVVRRGDEAVNLYDLPWLIRLLPLDERRQMAGRLLRMYPILARALEEATKGVRPPAGNAMPMSEGMPREAIVWGFADSAVRDLINCLAVCIDREAPPTANREDVLRRARAFVR